MNHARAQSGFAGWLWEWTKSIGVALVVWFFLRTFLVEAFRIPSGSMENTLLVGDFLFVNKALYGAEIPLVGARLPAVREPERNDILVFDSVEEEGLKVVQRLVGMPGDTLAMEGGTLVRNGERVTEPYALQIGRMQECRQPVPDDDGTAPSLQMREWQSRYYAGPDVGAYRPSPKTWGPIVVPPEHYFMMGDNRDNSWDSRFWGFLPRANVRGRPLVIYYSFDGCSYRTPSWIAAIRWDRLFTSPE